MADRRPLLAAACGALSLVVLSWMLVSHAWPLWTGETIYLRVRPVDPRDFFRGDYVVLGYDIDRLVLEPLAGERKLAGAASEESAAASSTAGDEPEAAVTAAPRESLPEHAATPAESAPPPAVVVEASDALRVTIESVLRDDAPSLVSELADRMLCVQLEEEGSPAPGVPRLHGAVRAGLEPEPGRRNLCGRIRWDRWRSFGAGDLTLDVDFGIDALFVPEGAGRAIERAIQEGKPVFAEIAVTESGRGRLRDLIVDGQPVLGAKR